MSAKLLGNKPANYGSKLQSKNDHYNHKVIGQDRVSNDGADHLFHQPFKLSLGLDPKPIGNMGQYELFHSKTTKSQTLKLKARRALNRDYAIIYYIKVQFFKYKRIISYQILARMIQTSANHLPAFSTWI